MTRPPARATLATSIACAAHALGVLASVVAWLALGDERQAWLFSPAQRIAFRALAAAGVVSGTAALLVEWRRRSATAVAADRRGAADGRHLAGRTSDLAVLRHLLVTAVAWAAAQWLLANRFHAALAWVAASAALLAFAWLRLLWPAVARWTARGPGLWLDRLAFQTALALVLLEGGLRVVGAVSNSPLFGLLDEDERDVLARFAMAPGYLHFGFRCNAGGHYDEPFTPGTGRGDVVVSIGDSFAVGVVPHRRHFTTVCERILPGTRVHNLGVSAIGPAGYHHLLVEQGLALRPDAVVIALFLGNDIGNAMRWRDQTSWLAPLLDRRSIRTLQIPLRLWRMRNQPAGLPPEAESHPLGIAGTQEASDDATLRQLMGWLDDPLREPPMFTPDAYLAIEVERARVLQRADTRGLYRKTFAALAAMHEACGAIPFGVLLIPDEFQVEDSLWAEVSVAAPLSMPRDDPQRRVAEWLRQQGIAHVDLLPDLLATPPLGDGRRHVYHLRDTHFNARGNEIAGRGLARLVRTLLGR